MDTSDFTRSTDKPTAKNGAALEMRSSVEQPEALARVQACVGSTKTQETHAVEKSEAERTPGPRAEGVKLALETAGTRPQHSTSKNSVNTSQPFLAHADQRRYSVDSTGHVSLAESEVSTSRPLLPVSPDIHGQRHHHTGLTARPETPPMQGDLPAHERSILNRRTLKLQQVLGEALSEAQVGAQIVNPRLSQQHLPKPEHCLLMDHSEDGAGCRESADNDHVPRERQETPSARPRRPSDADTVKSAQTISFRNRRFSEVLPFNLGNLLKSRTDSEWQPEEIHMPSDESSAMDSQAPVEGPPGRRNRQSIVPVTTPSSPTRSFNQLTRLWTESYSSDNQADEAALEKTIRRRQLAKLHRLLGARVPTELLFPSRIPSPPMPPANLAVVRDISLRQARRAELRTAPSSWTKRLKDSLIREKEGKLADALPIPKGSYLQSEGHPLDPLEKQMAVKKASKMRYLFGEDPPLSTYLPASAEVTKPKRPAMHRHSISDSASMTREYASAATVDTYRKSLASIGYLASRDPSSLRSLVNDLRSETEGEVDDTIAMVYTPSIEESPSSAMGMRAPIDNPSSGHSPLTPDFDKSHFSVLRRRAGKLSWLLGNPVAAQIASHYQPLDESSWTDLDALMGLLSSLEWAAEVDAADGVIGREALEVIRAQVNELKSRHRGAAPRHEGESVR